MPKEAKSAKTKEDYEELGRRLENIYLTGYINKHEMFKMSFLKGLVTGFGGIVGATIGLTILVWILSLLSNVPLIDRAADNVKDSVQSQKK
jgi:hypothetical protein